MSATMPTVEELYAAMGRMIVRIYGRVDGARCDLLPRAALACSGLDDVSLNYAVIYGDAWGDDAAEAVLRVFAERLRERGVGGYVCASRAVSAPLAPVARELGLEPLPDVPLMMRGGGPVDGTVASPSPDDASFTVRPATSAAGVSELLRVSEAAFGLPVDLYGRIVTPDLVDDPAVTVYLGRRGTTTVSCAFVVDDDDLVGVSGLATLPEWEGRGYGGRTLRAVAEANPTARAFYLTADAGAEAFYRAHGYELVDAAAAWVVPPPVPDGRRRGW